MKRILIFNLMLLLVFISCEVKEDDTGESWTPPHVTNLKFSPKKLKCEDELTITFTVSNIIGDDQSKAWNNATLNDNFQITELGNNIVELNLNIPENINPIFNTTKNGEKEIIYLEGLDESTFKNVINPNKYTYFKVNGDTTKEIIVELRCIIPNGAKSSFFQINVGNTYDSGFSEEKLIIIDENGNEVTE